MFRFHSLAIITSLASLLLTGAAFAGGRVALVIGNSAYKHVSELKNPSRDANAMAATLATLDFDVVHGIDLTRIGFIDKIREFSKKTRGADVALFFYAGHGLQVGGRNYLAPIDARIEDENDLDFEAIPLSSIMGAMERETRINLVFLDACRDNPMAKSLARNMGTRSAAVGKGLAPIDSGSGTLIGYATQPGNVALDGTGQNSPFTTSLLKHITTPNLDVAQLMRRVRKDVKAVTNGRQIPWTNESLTDDFAFLQSPTTNVQSVSALASEAERSWDLIQTSTDTALLALFAKKYEGSFHAALAIQRLAALGGTKRAIAVVPNGVVQSKTGTTNRLPGDDNAIRACDLVAAVPGNRDNPEGIKGLVFESLRAQKALAACEEAVAQNPDSSRSLFHLGRANERARDFETAVKFYTASLEQGYKFAAGNLGRLHEVGLGVTKDPFKAVSLYRRATRSGDNNARYLLGKALQSGSGVEPNATEAYIQFRVAASSGIANAQFEMAETFRIGNPVQKNDGNAWTWYLKAAKQGHAAAQYQLARTYALGVGVARNKVEAAKWFRLSAAQGQSDAQNQLGYVYEFGEGAEKDSMLAADYYFKALASNNNWTISKDRWDRETTMHLQYKLSKKGVFSGTVDGTMGPDTRTAMQMLCAC
ncbi:MAG: caspase family protein [Cohaesibacteraceae bacterium]|nr:caspase family protein [Cohaesibacteraceae bacterium]